MALLFTTVFAQNLCHRVLLIFDCDGERGFAVIVQSVNVRIVSEQELGKIELAAAGGLVQRTSAFLAATIYVGAACYQWRANDRVVIVAENREAVTEYGMGDGAVDGECAPEAGPCGDE